MTLAPALLAFIGLCTAQSPAAASPAAPGTAPNVVIVADGPSKLVDDARRALEQDGARVSLRMVDAPDAFAAAADADTAFLAAGKRSAAALARTSLSRRAGFLVKRADAGGDVASGMALGAVTLDPALDEQMRWLKLAFPGRARVIVPRSRSDDDDALRAAAARNGLTAVLVDVKAPGEAVPAVEAALKAGGPATIFLVADPVAVTADTVAPLSQVGLAARAPVVGFSSYFLKVGALAAVSVDVGAMARQALALAKSGANAIEAPDSARLVVDGKLAERIGVAVRPGPGVEVRR